MARKMNSCLHPIIDDIGKQVGTCGRPLDFIGIKNKVGEFERWDRADCGWFTKSDGQGTILLLTREEPRKGYFNGETPR